MPEKRSLKNLTEDQMDWDELENLEEEEPRRLRSTNRKESESSFTLSFWVNLLTLILVAASLLLTSLSLASLRSSTLELEEKVEALEKKIGNINLPSLAVENTQTFITWNASDPLAYSQTDAQGILIDGSLSIKVLDISTAPAMNVSCALNAESISSMAAELNAADSDYTWQILTENDALRLIVSPKDEQSTEGKREYYGRITADQSYLAGNAGSSLNLELSSPVLEMINRFVALNQSGSVAFTVDLSYQSLENKTYTQTVQLKLANVDAQPVTAENAYGSAGYLIKAVSE